MSTPTAKGAARTALGDVNEAQARLAKAREAVELRNVDLADAIVAAVADGESYTTVAEQLGMKKAAAHAFAKRWSTCEG